MDIKALRKNLKITQGELAEKLKVPMKLVKSWEHKEARPSPVMLRKLARLERSKE